MSTAQAKPSLDDEVVALRRRVEQLTEAFNGANSTKCHYMEKWRRCKEALEFIAEGYDRVDVSHVDFRVKAAHAANDALYGTNPDHEEGLAAND
jgi:hypothetical protein